MCPNLFSFDNASNESYEINEHNSDNGPFSITANTGLVICLITESLRLTGATKREGKIHLDDVQIAEINMVNGVFHLLTIFTYTFRVELEK